MLVFTLRGCRLHTVRSLAFHVEPQWSHRFQQHHRDINKSTSICVFTLRRLLYVQITNLNSYNFLEVSARLSRVYARPLRGSQVDREPPNE